MTDQAGTTPDRITLAEAKALADGAGRTGRSPESLEIEAAGYLAASSVVRHRRASPADAHELAHLDAMSIVRDTRRCGDRRCVLEVRRSGLGPSGRYSLHLQVPWTVESGRTAAPSPEATPESLEAKAGRLQVAAYIMRDRRNDPADRHERKHLAAEIEVGNSGRCRGPRCVLQVRRADDKYQLTLDIPWDSRTSDFDRQH